MVTHHPKDGHSPSKIKIYQNEAYYRLGIWHLDLIPNTKMAWMVSHYPQDGHPPPHEWSLTIQNLPERIVLQAWNLASTLNSQNQDQVTTVMDGHPPSKGWLPTIQNLKEVYYRLRIWHIDFIPKLRPGDNCHGWSATIPWMVTQHPRWSPIILRSTIIQNHLPKYCCPAFQGWSPTIPCMVTHHPKLLKSEKSSDSN